MAKPKKRYVCQACGGVSHRWQGQCPDCAEWNTLAEDAPATVNEAPQGEGWFVKIKLSDKAQLDAMMDDAAYAEHTK